MATESFEEAWAAADAAAGWLTREQAAVLWQAVRARGPGPAVVEIGSHQGRSTLVLASAVGEGTLTAIDPFVACRRYAGISVKELLEENLARAGLRDRVDLLVARSQDVLLGWDVRIDVLFVDGQHDYWSTGRDLRWAAHVVPGGAVLVHDAFSSLGVTTAILRHLLVGRTGLVYLGRTGSLANFYAGTPTLAERATLLRELPWWGRNLAVKVLLRIGLHRVARAMHHLGTDDPF